MRYNGIKLKVQENSVDTFRSAKSMSTWNYFTAVLRHISQWNGKSIGGTYFISEIKKKENEHQNRSRSESDLVVKDYLSLSHKTAVYYLTAQIIHVFGDFTVVSVKQEHGFVVLGMSK